MKSTKYTKEILEPIVKDSISLAEVLRKLGKKWSGGQQQLVKNWITRYELDTSHFLGQRANCGDKHKGGPRKLHWQEVLVLNEKLFFREKTFKLCRALVESGVKYKCIECGNKGFWRGKKIKLQVNHKNGNWKDNRKENLEFLCPNCHAATENWSKSSGSGVMAAAQR